MRTIRLGRRLWPVVFAVVLATSVEAKQTPTFKSTVNIVSVDVVALDKDGRPARGLVPENFTVTLDGHPAPVKVLSFVESQSTDTSPKAGDARTVMAPRTFVILLDDLSMSFSRGKSVLAAAKRFLDRLPSEDLVGFSTTSGHSIVNPTSDRSIIGRALSRATGEAQPDVRKDVSTGETVSVGIVESLDIEFGLSGALKTAILRECRYLPQGLTAEQLTAQFPCAEAVLRVAKRTAMLARATARDQLSTLEDVISAMGVAPGIKHLVLVSDGLAVRRDLSSVAPIARAAAMAGVQLSVLTEEFDSSLADQESAARLAASDSAALVSDLQTVTDMAGGSFYKVIGSADPFFDRVLLAASGVYRLGVEAPPAAASHTFEVSAKVSTPGVVVRVNRVAMANESSVKSTSAAATVERDLGDVIAGKLKKHEFPVTVGTSVRRADSGSSLEVDTEVVVKESARAPLIVTYGIVDQSGAIRGGRRTVAEAPENGPFRLTLGLAVPAGDYRVRVGVADATGAIGSSELAVSAGTERLRAGLVSDLITSWIDSNRREQFLGTSELPASAQQIGAMIELYPVARRVSRAPTGPRELNPGPGTRDPGPQRFSFPPR